MEQDREMTAAVEAAPKLQQASEDGTLVSPSSPQ